MAYYNNSEVQQIWLNNGGNPEAAAIMGAIAMAESTGNSAALNNNPATGDFSVGLWQVNYYGSLGPGRTAAYGTWQYLQNDVNAQAKAAISISGNGTSFTAWSTYNSGAYLQYLDGSTPSGIVSTSSATSFGPQPSLATLGTNPGAAFGETFEISDLIINGSQLSVDVQNALQDSLINRTIATASTVTMQISDPTRKLLRAGILKFGYLLSVADLSFMLVQATKAGDTLQVVFETAGIALLRQQVGVQATTTTNNITSFIASLVSAVPGLGFVGYNGAAYADAEQTTAVSIGRGTTADPFEDSWTCIQRVATSAGWRCFEVNNTVYLGPDSFFLGQNPVATLSEFTPGIQNMDFDYDIGKPFGTVTVTAMTGTWGYNPGQIVLTSGMGPLDSQPWIIQSMRRDMFNPLASIVLYSPMTPQYAIAAPTYAPF